jgi:hypothetical protein
MIGASGSRFTLARGILVEPFGEDAGPKGSGGGAGHKAAWP